MKTKDRADKLTKDTRVRAVMEWILQGYMTRDIITQCFNKWQIDERMAYKYIKECKSILAAARKGELSERIDFYLAAKMKLYNEMKDKATPKGAAVANDILDSMATLEGIVTNKIDITSKGDKLTNEVDLSKVPTDVLKVLLTTINKTDDSESN